MLLFPTIFTSRHATITKFANQNWRGIFINRAILQCHGFSALTLATSRVFGRNQLPVSQISRHGTSLLNLFDHSKTTTRFLSFPGLTQAAVEASQSRILSDKGPCGDGRQTVTNAEQTQPPLSKDVLEDLVSEYSTRKEAQKPPSFHNLPPKGVASAQDFSGSLIQNHSFKQIILGEQKFVDRPLNNIAELLREFWMAWNNDNTSEHDLFQAYQSLPVPRLDLFSERQAHDLLRRFIVKGEKTQYQMLRYMTLIDDMKVSGISITRKEWNTAISYVGRAFGRVRELDVQSALFFWREMEKGAGIPATTTTFNIMYDIVSKSQLSHLPELILHEMQSRKLTMDRYTYVGIIAYKGRCGNGAAVRKAYKDLVNSGEIVDTVVLNAVMGALIAAGEPQGALHVLEKMKKVAPASSSWQYTKDNIKTNMGSVLKKLAKERKLGVDVNQNLPESIISPDMISFSMFMNHFCERTADFEQACGLLDDMAQFGIVPGRPIFQALFKGFAMHGNLRYSPWTIERLDTIYDSFLETEVLFGRNVALWCLGAYLKKSNVEKAEGVWNKLQEKWKGQMDDMDLLYIRDRFDVMKVSRCV